MYVCRCVYVGCVCVCGYVDICMCVYVCVGVCANTDVSSNYK